MPDKTTFTVRFSDSDTDTKISIMRVIFPNGCIFYKVLSQGSFWMVNANDRWKITAVKMPDKALLTGIINLVKNIPGDSPFLRVEK
jgi:hypothetical protein